jgi:iron-sulfur cluster assembly protein
MVVGCNDSPVSRPPNAPLPPTPASTKAAATADEAPLITVTPKAAATINQIVNQVNAEKGTTERPFLRVRVVPGGCQGFLHKLDLDPDTSPADHRCESQGVRVVFFKRQMEMLRGAEVDFGEENGQVGFKIENPNLKGESAKKWLPLLEKEKDIK